MSNRILLFFIFCSVSLGKVRAQDPIFSQYFLIPETINPGFSGFLETTYVGGIHRTQWPDLNLRIDTEYFFGNTWLESMNSAVGISIVNHRESNTGYNFIQGNINYMYRVRLSDSWYFRPAIEVGLGNKSFGFRNLLLQDQININNNTISPISGDPVQLNERINFIDISSGMVFNNENLWLGLSVKHLNKPNIAFAQGNNIPLDIFFSASAGYKFQVAEFFDLKFFPYSTNILLNANYMQQGNFNRFDAGLSFLFERFFLGASVVTNPARNTPDAPLLTSVITYLGLEYEKLKFGLSYDINTTRIGQTGGVYELSLTYQFDLTKKCFGCPGYTAGN
ncbi:MAG: PorP/SprF family type IX secretion system membrane protein [Leeuwenhoekiella sp.]